MARIAIDARLLNSLGPGRYINRLLNYLQKIDTENEYLVLLSPDGMEDWNPTNPNFTKIEAPYKIYTFGEQLGFAKLLYSLKADLVHFTMPQQPLLYFKRSVTTIHDLTLLRFDNLDKNIIIYKFEKLVFRFLLFWVAHKSKTVITPTGFVKLDVIKFARVNHKKVHVTLESADKLAETPVPYAGFAKKKFIFYVGNSFPYKNLKALIEAFKIVQKTQPKLHLVIAGKKNFFHEELEKLVEQKGIKNVVFTGFIPDSQLRWMYEHATAYVFPSLSEGFGLPALEAMHYDLPVISSNATCLPEVYGNAALYFNPSNVKDMAKAIDKVVSNKKLRKELVENAQKRLKKFSWRTMAKQTHEIYLKSL